MKKSVELLNIWYFLLFTHKESIELTKTALMTLMWKCYWHDIGEFERKKRESTMCMNHGNKRWWWKWRKKWKFSIFNSSSSSSSIYNQLAVVAAWWWSFTFSFPFSFSLSHSFIHHLNIFFFHLLTPSHTHTQRRQTKELLEWTGKRKKMAQFFFSCP